MKDKQPLAENYLQRAAEVAETLRLHRGEDRADMTIGAAYSLTIINALNHWIAMSIPEQKRFPFDDALIALQTNLLQICRLAKINPDDILMLLPLITRDIDDIIKRGISAKGPDT